jgi:peptide/nickel transport system ATP-binding protein
MGPLLTVDNLKVWLDVNDVTIRAIDGVSLELRRSETFALVGESGCGKSMTALAIMRLLPDIAQVVAGAIKLDNEDLLQLPENRMRAIRGKRISMIFQEPMTSLNPVLTIGDQVAETLRRHTPLRADKLRRRVLELFDAVQIPDARGKYDEYPFQLSGGMKQRAMIALALACGPDILIADEPTTALDVTTQSQILKLLRELQRQTHMAILLITHDLGIVSQMAHTVAVMYAGEIVEIAGKAQFFLKPQHPYSRKLFESVPTGRKRQSVLSVIKGNVPSLAEEFSGCRFTKRCDYAFSPCAETPPQWTQLDTERGVRCHLFAEPASITLERSSGTAPSTLPLLPKEEVLDRAPTIEVEDLKVYFPIHKGLLKRVVGYVKAVDGVTLRIRGGQTLALVGESGCGKTTVGKGILQLIPNSAGKVRFNGAELTNLRERSLRPKRAEFQIVFQDPYSSLNPKMRIADILEEGMISLNVTSDRSARERTVDDLLLKVGLSADIKYRYPHEFSGGQRQRIAIARALAVNPKLIICDEPTSALDVSVQAQILNLLRDLQTSFGLAYLFITHNISVVEYLADEIAVMYLGRIVEYGKVNEVLENPQHPYTKALLSAVPKIDEFTQQEIIVLQGDLPSPANPPTGCYFHPRCPVAMDVCAKRYPDSAAFSKSHEASCHLYS